MRHDTHDEIPVLIAGAGPAGLTAAITLARAGIDCLLVERRDDRAQLPRATAISTRTMELMRSWGLEDEIRAGGVDVVWEGRLSETLASVADGSAFAVGMPSPEQSALVSPSGPACVPQDHLEPVLLSRLRSLRSARVAFGTEVVRLAERPDGVEAVLRERATGAERVVRARYLVAADGVRSSVRRALGIAMEGDDRLVEAVSAVFRAPLWPVLGRHRFGLYSVTRPAVAGAFLPAGRGDRWIYGVTREPGSADLDDRSEERFVRDIRCGAGVGDLPVRIEGIGAFAFAAQMAERFRAGSTFLVGDAAHRVTPRGGTGMNTAVHGAYDLGWKLAWVLAGWAAPELLDSYERERRPVAAHNVARSADPMGSVREAGQELHVDLGGRIAHLWLGGVPGRVSTLDLLGPGLTVLTGTAARGWEAAARAVRLPVAVRTLDPMTARGLGIPQAGALVVRPDGVPVASWPPDADPAAAIRAAAAALAADAAGSVGLPRTPSGALAGSVPA